MRAAMAATPTTHGHHVVPSPSATATEVVGDSALSAWVVGGLVVVAGNVVVGAVVVGTVVVA